MIRLILQAGAALAVSAIAGYLLLVRGPLEQLASAQHRHAELQREYIERLKFRVNLPLLRSQVPVMKDLDKAVRLVLPDFDGMAAGPRDLEESMRAAAKEKQLTPIGFSDERLVVERVLLLPAVLAAGQRGVSPGGRVPAQRVERFPPASSDPEGFADPGCRRDEVTLSLEALALRYREEESAVAERKAKTRALVGRPQ
jgi:hypothetical protein